MIAISRVFDIEGLWEVLGEIGHDNPAAPSNSSISSPKEVEKKSDGPIQSGPDWPEEINDSQEDSPDEDCNPGRGPSEAAREKDEGIEIIIIDNMSQIINELFSRKEKSDGWSYASLSFPFL
jgi:hypothetical protein